VTSESQVVPLRPSALEPAAERQRARESIERGLKYLRSQQIEGRIGARYPVATTSLAGLAILGAGIQRGDGGPDDKMLSGCLSYILSIAQKGAFLTEATGGEGESRMHGHCFAILFLTQIAGTLPQELEREVAGVIKRGVLVVEKAQSNRGGWYYEAHNAAHQDEASVTICALQALRAANNTGFAVDKGRVDDAVRYVKACQDPSDGSFRYSLTGPDLHTSYCLTAAAVSTLNAAGVYESLELRRGLDHLRKRVARHSRQPAKAAEEEFFFYGNLYAAQAFFQEGGATWNEWFPKVRQYLLQEQAAAGFWKSRFGNEYATASALLILELPLGYLPVFQR
jgi:hypothetical protein